MRAFALVTVREIRAYAPAWMAALATALLPWLAPLLPAVGRQPASDVRVATAAALGALLAIAFAAFAGAGLLARDLAEGRMGFFLALPLPAWAVWMGRLAAAVALVYGSVALVVLPPVLVGGEAGLRLHTPGGWPGEWFPLLGWLGTALIALAPLALLLLAHQLAIALRSRSPWLLADFGGLILAGVLLGRALGRLFVSAAVLEFRNAAALGIGLVLLALVLGGGVGLARGGVLLGRVHRAQATGVGAGLVAAALLVVGYARWVVAVDAGDLTGLAHVAPAPAGSWIAAVGPLRHRPSYVPWILVDTAGDSSLRLSPGIPDAAPVDVPPPLTFAADGRQALWLRPRGHVAASPSEVVRVELGARPRLEPTGIEVASVWGVSVLPVGDRIAVAEPRRLTVWGEGGRRLLAATELPRAWAQWQELRRVGPDRVRLVRLVGGPEEGSRLQAWDLDAATRRVQPLVDRPLAKSESLPALSLSADGSRLLLATGWAGRGGVSLLDASSGTVLAELAPAEPKVFVTARFLPGGEVAVATGRQERLTLRLFDREGSMTRELPLGTGSMARIGSPWSTHELPVRVSHRVEEGRRVTWQSELRLLDLATGGVRVLGGDYAPLAGASPWLPADDRLQAGAPASRLFHEPDGSLVRLGVDGVPERVLPSAG